MYQVLDNFAVADGCNPSILITGDLDMPRASAWEAGRSRVAIWR